MKGRLFARWKPPRGRWSKEEPSLRGRWPKEAAPLRGRRKAEEGTPWEKGRSFFAPKSNRRTRSRLLGGFPAGLSEKRRPNISLPSFFTLSTQNARRCGQMLLSSGTRRRRGQKCPFLPECAGDAAKIAPSARNARQRGQKRPFLPEYAGATPRNKPFAEAHTKNRYGKERFSNSAARLVRRFFFLPVLLPLAATPFFWWRYVPSGLFAPVNGGVSSIGGLPLATLRAWMGFPRPSMALGV